MPRPSHMYDNFEYRSPLGAAGYSIPYSDVCNKCAHYNHPRPWCLRFRFKLSHIDLAQRKCKEWKINPDLEFLTKYRSWKTK